MRIPAVQLMSRGGDEPAASLHESAREQQTLSQAMASVSVLGLVGFAGQIECGFLFGRQDHLHCLALECVHTGVLGGFDFQPVNPVHHAEKRSAVFESRRWKRLGKSQVLYVETLLA